MSIRLRLTLLYSVILALTLILFSAVLYIAQARYTLSIVEHDLEKVADSIVAAWTRSQHEFGRPEPLPGMARREGPEGDQARQMLQPLMREGRQRDIVRILDAEGVALDFPSEEEQIVLPLSEIGLEELLRGKIWIEIAHDDEEGRLLIYNQPIIIEGEVTGIVQVSRSLADRDRSLQSLGMTLLLGSILTTLIAFGAGWTLSGFTLHPIHRITQTAREIGEARDFSSRVLHAGPNDELGHLATTFNEMLSQLEVAYRQVTHALQVQRDFVADVSHELRTPLTTIRGNLALLQRCPPLPQAEQEDILGDLIGESERLSRLVSDLLTLARADAGRTLELNLVDVSALVDDVFRQVRLLAPGREIQCQCEAGGELVAVANEDALKQVLLILLDNAIKHTKSPVLVDMALSDSQVVIRVEDNGPGISPEFRSRIFDRFYRGDTSRSTPGFGLGLSIAQALTVAQHGSITVESQIGKGSAFIVKIPAFS
ncbi:MAG: HAMP domain-containing histidine kinase [Anaerolineae bacterium]|nr:HAMP domain-containing histidine kinase [Anaerolineae bacterium]